MTTVSRVLPILGGLLLVLAAITLAAPAPELAARAQDQPFKPPAAPKSLPAPDTPRQGGDTIADAVAVALPVIGMTGTTAGYTDDYDEACPYTGSTSPDVVYTFTPNLSRAIEIDMYGSSYDTKIYVYDAQLQLVACNDDFYPDYVSKLENVPVFAGVQYYLVIDGYGGDFGDYVLRIEDFAPCELAVSGYAEREMEPALADDYVDWHNGGCNTSESAPPFQPDWNYGWFHGRSGWYLNQGVQSRDTDWFLLSVPAEGYLEIVGDAEYPCYMFELAPQDCGSVGVLQSETIGPCTEGSMVITGAPGSPVWFWVGPVSVSPPDGFVGYEFDYLLFQESGAVTTESHSLSDVRTLFR